jgi:hypothetical protein
VSLLERRYSSYQMEIVETIRIITEYYDFHRIRI